MTNRLIRAAAVLVVALQAVACGSTSVTQITAPDAPRCQATIQSIPTIPAGGGRADVGVVTNRECAWTASSNSAWIQVSPTAGQGEASIALTTTPNPQGVTRSGILSVNGSQYEVIQAASPCTFTVAPTDVDAAATGGSIDLHVTTLVGCTWTASSTVAWVSLSPATGTGSGDAEAVVAPNTEATVRSADVRIAGTLVRISQAAPVPAGAPAPGPGTPPAPSPDPSQCTYTIDPAFRSFKDKGGDGTVKVMTGDGCPWMAVPDVPWVLLKSAPAGAGAGEVKYQVDRNRTGAARTGSITIAGQVHLIEQTD